MTLEEVIAGIDAGERRAIGRAISLVERLGPQGRELAAALHPRTGHAWRIGITGAPPPGVAMRCASTMMPSARNCGASCDHAVSGSLGTGAIAASRARRRYAATSARQSQQPARCVASSGVGVSSASGVGACPGPGPTLGGAGLGDIGLHFPDTDTGFQGADSMVLLQEAARRVRAQGYAVVNVDSTIVAQAPRMAPHIAAMRARIAAALGVAVEAVNVKAKTAEKMGPVGEGRAIEARAICLLCQREPDAG